MSLEELSRYLDEHDTVDSNKAILDSLKCKPFYCQWPTSEEEANAKPLRPVIGLYNCCL